MKEAFKNITTSIIITSILAFIIGLVMMVMPGVSLQAIGITIGILVILFGIVLIALNFTTKIYLPFYGVVSGVLSIVVGLILVAMPNILATVFVIALGIWIILSSVNFISVALSVKDSVSNWFWWLLLGVIDLIIGVVILLNPFPSSISIVMIAGIVIMIHSVITIVDTVMIRKDVKDVVKALESRVKGSKESK